MDHNIWTNRSTTLATARADPLLHQVAADGSAPPAAAAAAYGLAAASGYCRLSGIADPGSSGPSEMIPARFALAAATELTTRLDAWARLAEQLEASWERATNSAEADRLASECLRHRTETWAVMEEIQETLAHTEGPLTGAIADAIDSLAEPLDRFDLALERHADILSTLADSPLVAGWEERLVGEYRDPPPWWSSLALRSMAAQRPNLPVPATLRTLWVMPHVVPTASLAAEPERVVLPGPKWVWAHPNGAFRATLRVPVPLTPDELRTPRALTFRAPDGTPVRDFEGQPVRLGKIVGLRVGEGGRVMMSLSELTPGEPVRLWVGDPEQEWSPVLEDANGETDHG